MIKRIIIIAAALTLPVWGATQDDITDIATEVMQICRDSKLNDCQVKVVNHVSPVIYTHYHQIIISDKTIEKLNRDELRAAIYHELSHVLFNHSYEAEKKGLYCSQNYCNTEELRKFRYRMETEADINAVILLHFNGKPQALESALRTMTAGKDASKGTSLHPSVNYRVNDINKTIKLLNQGIRYGTNF